MKVSTPIVLASLATTGLAAHRGRHARFHDASAKREAEIIELSKRMVEADPTLIKRCGEMINSGQFGSFPMCWGDCAGSAQCGGSGNGSGGAAAPAAPSPAPAAPAPAPAAPASSPAPAAESPAAESPAASPASKQQNQDNSKPASSSGSTSDSTGKVGLAYNDVGLLSSWLGGDAAWAYNWGFQAGSGFPGNLKYVPMFHDKGQLSAFQKADFSSYTYLLSLNEPDKSAGEGGSSLSPADACSAHNSAFQNLQGKQISSPAVSSTMNTPGQGLDWLKQFKAACPNAKVDFVPLHYYGGGGSGAAQGADFLKYLATAKSTVNDLYPGKQIWWTEIAATPVTDAQVNADFLTAVMPSLKSDSSVGRVSPFMVGGAGALGNTPNAAGKVLISI